MKNAARLGMLPVALMMSLPLIAQEPYQGISAAPQQPANSAVSRNKVDPGSAQNASAKAIPVPSTANSPEIADPELRPVTAELVSKLDVRNAKTGDNVVVRTTEKATTATGIEIPKGSKIVGRITDVEAKGQGGDDSRIAIQFDRAQLRDGQSLPIRSVIQSVAPAGTSSGSPSPIAAPGPSTAAGAPSGIRETAPAKPGSATEASASSSDGTQPVGTVVARNGNVAIRTTAIPGVLLAGNTNGQPFSNASGALLGAQQNVHLDGGTVMTLAIATAPTGNAR